MSREIQKLIALLDLERIEQNLFRGNSPKDGWQRIFGGQVIGQSLMAAVRTVEDRAVHSLHGYFMRPGDPKVPIVFTVHRLRDGKSFTTRQVVAVQHGQAIFSMGVSFQRPEQGLEHQIEMPDVPPPEAVMSADELKQMIYAQMPEPIRAYWARERPIEIRPVDVTRFISREKRSPHQHVWMRATGKLPDDPLMHQCVLAYATDFTLLDTALIAHGRVAFDQDLQLASLDHAMWFHRPFRADDWLLFSQDSPTTGGNRGFCRGSVFTRDGRLIASVAQEGLVRERASMQIIKPDGA